MVNKTTWRPVYMTFIFYSLEPGGGGGALHQKWACASDTKNPIPHYYIFFRKKYPITIFLNIHTTHKCGYHSVFSNVLYYKIVEYLKIPYILHEYTFLGKNIPYNLIFFVNNIPHHNIFCWKIHPSLYFLLK